MTLLHEELHSFFHMNDKDLAGKLEVQLDTTPNAYDDWWAAITRWLQHDCTNVNSLW